MKTIRLKTTILILFSLFITACGGGGGNSSSFRENNNNPIVNSDGIYYVAENKREAFQIEAHDNSSLTYYLSGEDFNLLYIDTITGKVFFKEPTDYESKSVYHFNAVIQDSVGHRTTQAITINIKDTKNENFITASNYNSPLNNQNSKYFITTWKTDNEGKSNNNQIIIPTIGDGYDYSVDWGDGTSTKHLTQDATHTYDNSGIYTVKIIGDFPRIYFAKNYDHNDSTIDNDEKKILSIEQWGDIKWSSMGGAFANCSNLEGNSIDTPNLSNVTEMHYMFYKASKFNQDINSWDVSHITNMQGTFFYASSFNENIENWDVSHVTNMRYMFNYASNFNQNIGKWNVSNVKDMTYMFHNASNFNQDISSWDVSNVKTMEGLFYRASSFNKDIGSWNVSNVTNMFLMFDTTLNFNQDISEWDVSNVKNMGFLFAASKFNQDIGNWNLSHVTTTQGMFYKNKNFNKNIENWDTSSVSNMQSMFYKALSFNQNIENWDVSNVTNMKYMLQNASSFKNHNLSSWNVSKVTAHDKFLTGTGTGTGNTEPIWK